MEGNSAPKSSAPLSCPGTHTCTKTAREEISSMQGRAANLASGLWLDPMSWTVRKTTPSRLEFKSPWTKTCIVERFPKLNPKPECRQKCFQTLSVRYAASDSVSALCPLDYPERNFEYMYHLLLIPSFKRLRH